MKQVVRKFDRENFDPAKFIDGIAQSIREECGGRKVFLLVSGGVDSTVVFALLNKILGPDRVLGVHVDTGLMRLNESAAILDYLVSNGFNNLQIENAEQDFLNALDGVYDPEEKRKIIGDMYLEIKERVSKKLSLNAGEWILAQGTIYPDVLETAAQKEVGANGHRIKTHHNRVDAIVELIEQGMVTEPVAALYKDEVRKVGEHLGLPHEAVWRHPFPGPGLGVRVLCSDGAPLEEIPANDLQKLNDIAAKHNYRAQILPIRCTGNRGGVRTYTRPALITGEFDREKIERASAEIIAGVSSVDRVVYGLSIDAGSPPPSYKLIKAHITKSRLDKLRAIDDAVTNALKLYGDYESVWQMPVVLLPLVDTMTGGEAVVLRPIRSIDAMFAETVWLKDETIEKILSKRLDIKGIGDIFFDVTPKPPATIEWE